MVCLIHIEPCPEPYIQYCVKIDENLHLTLSVEKIPLSKLSKYSFPCKLDNFNDIVNILDFIEKNIK